jgi:hypothetical protein
MPDDKHEKIWVRVVEAHATRTWVAVILAAAAGISLIIIVSAAMWNTVANPEVTDLASNYASVISATLGVLVGSLATYVGNSATQTPSDKPPRDDEFVLPKDQDPPTEGDTNLRPPER